MTSAKPPAAKLSTGQMVIISGLSGSGKSTAIRCFEDMGYFCVDNLPSQLIPVFADLCEKSGSIRKIALVVDIREGAFLDHFPEALFRLRKRAQAVTLIFLEASDETLIRRFSESRRPHPLATQEPLEVGIRREREAMARVRSLADVKMDTSRYNVHELKKYLSDHFQQKEVKAPLVISIVSFGYKHGIPEESDLLFDARFIPNPFFVDALRPLSGLDRPVQDFLQAQPEYKEFLQRISDLLLFLLPHYVREGKTYFTISVGCTGGRHRSVAMAHELSEKLTSKGHSIKTRHRDLEKE